MTNNGTLNYNLTSEKPAYMLSEENYTKYINERNKFDPTYPDPNDIRFDAPQYSYSVEGTSLYKESSSGELTLVGSVYYPKTSNLVKFENNQAIELDEPVTGNKVPLSSIKKLIPEIEYEFVPLPPDYSKKYLTFVALEDGTFTFSMSQKLPTTAVPSISYSTNNGKTWTTVQNIDNEAVTVTTPTIKAGNKVLWKSNAVQYYTNSDAYPGSNIGQGSFSSTNTYNIEGNLMSLMYGDDFKGETLFKTKISSGYGTGAFPYLFENNHNIISVEHLKLPATTMANYCYYYMFAGCTNLTTASELPATIMANNCYYGMFRGCTSLITVPELPAITLANNCYSYMFNDCTSLTTVPELPATTLAKSCYSNMFDGCTSLTTTSTLPATTLADGCYFGMFRNTNVLPDTTNIDFTSQVVVASGGLKGLFSGTKITDNDLNNILPKNNNNKYCLPVTILSNACYLSMFSSCTNLTTAPELPATTLANYCYQCMFQGCTSLAAAPELSATTLANSCYDSMFNGCTSLTTAPELPIMTLATGCYERMFFGCTSLTSAPELPATTLAKSCYNLMFKGCLSLTTAPELPATTLVYNCYQYMFEGCKNLNYIKAMFTTTPSASYTDNWVGGVSSTGTFVKNSAAEWDVSGVNGVPTGWTVETA